MTANQESGFCTHCGVRITSFTGLSACPACGTQAVPCSDADQVMVSVNWHELRVLAIWAENWQRLHLLGSAVYAIARRLRAQHPTRRPLTLAGEMADLNAEFPGVQVTDQKLRRDVAEQHGVELDLVKGFRPEGICRRCQGTGREP